MSADDELRRVLDKVLPPRYSIQIHRRVDGTLSVSLIHSAYRHPDRPRKATSDGSDLLAKIESLAVD